MTWVSRLFSSITVSCLFQELWHSKLLLSVDGNCWWAAGTGPGWAWNTQELSKRSHELFLVIVEPSSQSLVLSALDHIFIKPMCGFDQDPCSSWKPPHCLMLTPASWARDEQCLVSLNLTRAWNHSPKRMVWWGNPVSYLHSGPLELRPIRLVTLWCALATMSPQVCWLCALRSRPAPTVTSNISQNKTRIYYLHWCIWWQNVNIRLKQPTDGFHKQD